MLPADIAMEEVLWAAGHHPPDADDQLLDDGSLNNSGPKLRVLVVDDEPLIADTITEILNQSGFVAEQAYDGKEALQKAEQWSPDVLLSDVLMPKLNGVELAIALISNHPNTRVLLFSGQAATGSVIQQARARGFDFEVLPKPIPPDQLISKLRN
jgi:CheY-like chemotaxis protein